MVTCVAWELLSRARLDYIPVDAKVEILSLYERVRSYSWRQGYFTYMDAIRPDYLEQFRVGYKNAQAFVRKFVQAGGKVMVGTDSVGGSVIPGLAVLEDMQLLVDSGLTAMQAIQAATSIPAESIGKQNEFGTIQPGRFADLVVLDSDPLQDIGNVRKISIVFQRGERIELGYRWNYVLKISNPVEDDLKSMAFIPVPVLNEIMPKISDEGGPSMKLRLNGEGFTTRSRVLWNGMELKTEYQNSSSLAAEVPAALLTSPGTWPVQVVNPHPGGGVSNELGFIVSFR